MSPDATRDALVPPVEQLYDGTSSTEQFIAFGEGFVRDVLVPRVGLQPNDTFLDLGCGNGSVARALTTFLGPNGRYEGLDVNGASVAWLQAHYRAHPSFRFKHADVTNKMYNPVGPVTAADYRLPYADDTFTFALLKSVFTHMHPRDVRHYLKEVSRVLRPGGRAVITYFLLNDESRRYIAAGADQIKMPFNWDQDPLCRIANLGVPEQATAHDEARIRAYSAEAGLSVADIAFGDWCGRPTLIGLQDLMVLLRT